MCELTGRLEKKAVPTKTANHSAKRLFAKKKRKLKKRCGREKKSEEGVARDIREEYLAEG